MTIRWTTALFLGPLLVTPMSLGVPPTIHADWDRATPPVESLDYFVRTDLPASIDYPDVELSTGDLSWRIWSTDPDNPDNLGDIGVISCPHLANFAVTIRNDADPAGRGARDVKGITLAPTSSGNYSNITDADIGDKTA